MVVKPADAPIIWQDFFGDEGDNSITGSDSTDRIYGYGGNDVLSGLQGNDSLQGGTGSDVLYGGDGDDGLFPDRGGGSVALYDDDTVWGGEGNDVIENGWRVQFDGQGNVTRLWTTDTLNGEGGDDSITVEGHAFVDGGDGNDYVSLGTSYGTATGGAGIDTLSVALAEYVLLHDVPGLTMIDYTIDLSQVWAGGSGHINSSFGTSMAIAGFEILEYLYTAEGNDVLNLGAVVSPTSFASDISTGGGNDVVLASSGRLAVTVGAGNDRVVTGSGNDTIRGGSGADRLSAGTGNDSVHGDEGNDVLVAGGGNDGLFGGLGADRLSGGTGQDYLDGGDGKDVLTGGSGGDELYGGAGADRFVFERLGDSRGAAKDLILDFSHAQGDTISLEGVRDSVGLGALTFISNSGFSRTAGEVRYLFDGLGDTIVQLDANGDGKVDMSILLSGEIALVSADFVL